MSRAAGKLLGAFPPAKTISWVWVNILPSKSLLGSISVLFVLRAKSAVWNCCFICCKALECTENFLNLMNILKVVNYIKGSLLSNQHFKIFYSELTVAVYYIIMEFDSWDKELSRFYESRIFLVERQSWSGMVAHALNPSTWKAEAGVSLEPMNLRSA